jgi:hypothetical protein
MGTRLTKIKRLFIIKTPFEAGLVIYALGLGGAERGLHYIDQFPGFGGKLLFTACLGTVMIAGAKIVDAVKYERRDQLS